ncbi:MAG: MarR family winged helix-turn-helix transcriptional regulator [Acidimicrobiales bacterium]
MTTPWLDGCEMAAWRGFTAAHARLVALLDLELEAEHGLSLGEYEVLAVLSEVPEQRMRMTELAHRALVSPSTLTRRLDRLAGRGLVDRQRCATDARGMFAVLTEAGRAQLVEAAPTHLRGVRHHFFDRLAPGQLAALTGVVERIAP